MPRTARPSLPLRAALAVVAAATAALLTAAPAGAGSPEEEGGAFFYCLQFSTQEAAQAFFDAPDPGADVSQMDSDGDGTACEDDEVPEGGVACPPEEVSDIIAARPGECAVPAATTTAPPTPTPSPSPTTPSASGTPEPTPTATATTPSEEGSTVSTGRTWGASTATLVGGVVLLAAVAAGVAVLVRRRQRPRR